MAAAFVKLKNPFLKNILEENRIKKDILDDLLRKIKKDFMPYGGVYFVQAFPTTTCGKVDKLQLAARFGKE